MKRLVVAVALLCAVAAWASGGGGSFPLPRSGVTVDFIGYRPAASGTLEPCSPALVGHRYLVAIEREKGRHYLAECTCDGGEWLIQVLSGPPIHEAPLVCAE